MISTWAESDGAGRVARRRARVRDRLLQAAEALIGERGVEAVTIEDITDAADIARRTFYHHFESKNELLVPIAHRRTAELNRRLDDLVARIADPAEGMATALRHGFREIPADPLCRWFVLHSGLPVERLHQGFGESALRDVRRAADAGRFHVANVDAVSVLLAGAFVAVVAARVEGKLGDVDLDVAVEHVLRLLGLDRKEAARIAHLPLLPLDGDPS